jgi:hypothetical protein
VNKTLESSVISYQPELSKKANQAVRAACPNGSFANTFVDQSMLNILLPTRHMSQPADNSSCKTAINQVTLMPQSL